MKARNFDSVLLFKMGKFYEMFEMDAYVGVEVLGLMLMRVSGCTTGTALQPHRAVTASACCMRARLGKPQSGVDVDHNRSAFAQSLPAVPWDSSIRDNDPPMNS